uniref:Uncharacterized protein n=1 Tax=Grammatophora oceanica TaxID=210454 RepID=A0A7S1UZ77_9STRA
MAPSEGGNSTLAPEEGEETLAPSEGGNETVIPEEGGNETVIPEEGGNETVIPGEGGSEVDDLVDDDGFVAEDDDLIDDDTVEPAEEDDQFVDEDDELTDDEIEGADDFVEGDDFAEVDDDQVPVSSPTTDSWPTPDYSRTERPTELYIPPDTDDDPVKAEEEGEENEPDWNSHHETPEEMMNDPNVLKVIGIAMGATFGVMLLLSVCVAHQVQNNPDGCCASVCRLATTCTCCVFKILCFPCRMMCGGSKSGGRHSPMMSDTNTFTHDLELS